MNVDWNTKKNDNAFNPGANSRAPVDKPGHPVVAHNRDEDWNSSSFVEVDSESIHSTTLCGRLEKNRSQTNNESGSKGFRIFSDNKAVKTSGLDNSHTPVPLVSYSTVIVDHEDDFKVEEVAQNVSSYTNSKKRDDNCQMLDGVVILELQEEFDNQSADNCVNDPNQQGTNLEAENLDSTTQLQDQKINQREDSNVRKDTAPLDVPTDDVIDPIQQRFVPESLSCQLGIEPRSPHMLHDLTNTEVYGIFNNHEIKENLLSSFNKELENGFSAIFPTNDFGAKPTVLTNTHEKEEDNAEIQLNDEIENRGDDFKPSSDDKAAIGDQMSGFEEEISQSITRSIQENSKFKDVESKLDSLAQLFSTGITNLKEEVLTAHKHSDNLKSIVKPVFVHSGIGTKHYQVYCNNCGAMEFTGKRYKCLECLDFDLCEACEASGCHPHVMLRIMAAQQPKKFDNLVSYHLISKKVESQTDDQVKESFLRSISGNQYPEMLIKQVLLNNKNLGCEAFIIEMLKIFG